MGRKLGEGYWGRLIDDWRMGVLWMFN